jgi:protein phosphatase PTC7
MTILRDGRPIFISEVQTHYFNCPYQLSKIPIEQQRQKGGGENIVDTPSKADSIQFALQPNDIVILYTDGLSDNLPAEHLPLLSKAIDNVLSAPNNAHLGPADRAAERARLLADVLVGYGRMAMARTGEEDGGRGWKTPFELEARRNRYNFMGGKIDE